MDAPDPSAPLFSRPLNVLVVEDDSDVVPLIDRGLRAIHSHYSLSWTSDAQGARRALRSQEFDLVIADYTLDGGGTGWSLLQEVRQSCPDAQVGLVSALPLGMQRIESRFLRKPFSQAELISFLRPLVEKCELAGLPVVAPLLAAQPPRRRSVRPSRAQHRSR